MCINHIVYFKFQGHEKKNRNIETLAEYAFTNKYNHYWTTRGMSDTLIVGRSVRIKYNGTIQGCVVERETSPIPPRYRSFFLLAFRLLSSPVIACREVNLFGYI